MKSKASFFNFRKPFISTALIKENLRIYWPLSLILFLIFFLPSCFILLMSSGDTVAQYAELCLTNGNPAFIFGLVVFPVLISGVLFKYLYKSGSTTTIHSLPLTRTTLFFSNYFSGAILLLTPLILNAIALVPLFNGVQNYIAFEAESLGLYSESYDAYPFKVFGLEHIGLWLGISVLTILFIYTLSVLASMVSGNMVLHVINSLLLIFAPLALFYITSMYLEAELLGFSFFGFIQKNMEWFSPLFDGNGLIPLERTALYIGIIIVGFFLSNFLYGRRKLEKAGDSLVFRFTEPIVVFLIAFLGMSFVCMFVYLYGINTGFIFYCSVGAASVIALIIANMIVQKTSKIFNKKTLSSSLIYAVIVIVFATCVHMDVLKLETSVPEKEDIQSISINAPNLSSYPYKGIGYNNYDAEVERYKFKSAEAIKYITALHKELTTDETLRKGSKDSGWDNYYDWAFRINYDLKKGSMQREYALTYENIADNDNYKKLIETEEYKNLLSLKAFGYDKIESANFNLNYVSDISKATHTDSGDDAEFEFEYKSYSLYLQKKEVRELIKVLDKDFMEQTADELSNQNSSIAELNISMEGNKNDDMDDVYLTYSIPASYDYTIAWLKENNYYDKLVFCANDIEDINVKIVKAGDVISSYTVTDEDKIKSLFDNASTSLESSDKSYVALTINYKKEALNKLRSLSEDGEGSGNSYDRETLDLDLSSSYQVNMRYITYGNKLFYDIVQSN